MSAPRLFIHIGHPKTGTTSIQTFLEEKRDALRAEGVLVPRSGLAEGAHHGLARNFYAVRNRPDRSGQALDALRREVAEAAPRTVVVSSEGFIQESPQRLAGWLEGADVTVLYYIRRQDLVVESVYAQRVRSQLQLAVQTPQAMLGEIVPRYADILARFESAFGRERLRVRPFEPASFEGGTLLSDFLTLIGVDPARFPEAERRRNTAFKRDYLEFKRVCNLLPLLEPEWRSLGAELERLSEADDTPQPRHLFSREERERLLASCEAVNREIARRHLGREDGILFREQPKPDEEAFRPFGTPPAAVQARILERLSPALRELLETLDVGIRQRLPGEAFMPVIPDDPRLLRKRVRQRDFNVMQRRLGLLEGRADAPTPEPSNAWTRGRRLAGRFLRALRG